MPIKQVEKFVYLDDRATVTGKCDTEIKWRITTGRSAFAPISKCLLPEKLI